MDDLNFGFSIKMSPDDKTAELQLRSDEPITDRMMIEMIEMLEALAEKIREDSCEVEGPMFDS